MTVGVVGRNGKPGSPESKNLGCTCPAIDNHHGKGYRGDGVRYGWLKDPHCPVHGTRKAAND